MKEHDLLTEARTCDLRDQPRARLAFIFAGCMIGNRKTRALVTAYVDDVDAYEAAKLILAERMLQEASSLEQRIDASIDRALATLTPVPATLPGQAPVVVVKSKITRLVLPGRPARRWDCQCQATNDAKDTHCAACLGFREVCEEKAQATA